MANCARHDDRASPDMTEFKPAAYRSYAEFFGRAFRADARPFAS
jgi:hypothetical protein